MAGDTKGSQGQHARGQGQGHNSGHGHEHRGGRPTRPAAQRQRKTEPPKPARNETRPEPEPEPEPETRQRNGSLALADDDATVFQNGDERVLLTQEVEEEEEGGRRRGSGGGGGGGRRGRKEGEERMEEEGEEEEDEEEEEGEDNADGFGRKGSYGVDLDRLSGRSDSIGDWNDNAGRDSLSKGKKFRDDDFNVKSFNDNLDKFVGILSDPRYQEMHSDYPVEDLVSVVSMVSATIEEYKDHSQHTQNQLSHLRDAMKTVKENLHLSITRQAFDLSAEERQTAEELELKARLAQLNVTVAEAHSQVAEASKLSAETEQVAVQANIAAEQARQEAQRIQEELELKAEQERKKKEEEEQRRLEEERQREEERKKKEEEERAKEEARKKQAEARSGAARAMEQLQTFTYSVDDEGSEGSDLLCIIKAKPDLFKQSDVTCNVISQQNTRVTYGEQEELISRILELVPTKEDMQTPQPIHVAVPYTIRLPAAREPVVKAMVDGRWKELVTVEVSFDGYKEYRFAQAEVKQFTKLLVMSRFKRDYLMVQNVKRVTKLTSSYDHRVVLTVPKDAFTKKERLVLQVQPVDSNSVSEFRALNSRNKVLLTSSPILHMEWQTVKFEQPINILLPCPPNPAKARKMALAKKQKEEKQKAPAGRGAPPPPPDEASKPKRPAAPAARQQQQHDSGAEEDRAAPPQRQNKWYMGQYGQTEDDENDQLCLMMFSQGRWAYMPEVKVSQAKVDLLTFNIESGCDRLVVLRTRTETDSEELRPLVLGLTKQLSMRTIRIFLKQQAEDQYDVCCHVVPTAGADKAERYLKAEGYTVGPDKVNTAMVQEGDAIILVLRGNLRFQTENQAELCLIFNSNLPTTSTFRICEIDRYLQRNHNVYRGAARVFRSYEVAPPKTLKPRAPEEENVAPPTQRDRICDVDLEIPKMHVEPDPIPRRVPVVLREPGPLDDSLLRQTADDLGAEWQLLADRLHVDHVRVQAIIRTSESEEHAKYDMLMTWMKRCPQAADKLNILISALQSVGRHDLAAQLKLHRHR